MDVGRLEREVSLTKVLLSVHVIAAILAIGPIAVAASLFPRYARRPLPDSDDQGEQTAGVAAFLHRICRGYAVVGIVVPVFGFATGAQLGVLTDPWLIASVVLTAIAAAVLVLAILPGQRDLLTTISAVAPDGSPADTSHTAPAEAPDDASSAAAARDGAPGEAPDDASSAATADTSNAALGEAPDDASSAVLGGASGAASDGAAGRSSRSMEARLAALTGVFNILWAIVVVLMIVRPGSTTGA
jgi:hypothetical protein